MLLLILLWGYWKDPKFFEVSFVIGDFLWSRLRKRLGIWVGVMQPFCLVNEKTEDILII